MNTDNQQQTVSDFEVGWMTGLIEGEGTVSLTICKRNGRGQQIRVIPRVIVANSDVAIIEKYLDILGRMGIGKYVRRTKPNNLKVSKLFAMQGIRTNFRDITTVYVEGFKRMLRLLTTVTQHMVGEKKLRASLLLKFIQKRVSGAEQTGKTSNYLYDNDDVALMLEFLDLTKSPNKAKIAGMLNEHTQEARREIRRKYKRAWHVENRERENYLRRISRGSRCALDS